jgi:hypothetical protein
MDQSSNFHYQNPELENAKQNKWSARSHCIGLSLSTYEDFDYTAVPAFVHVAGETTFLCSKFNRKM